MDLFLLSLTKPQSFEFFYLIVYQVAVTNLMFVPCYFSSVMTMKSEKIPNSAYNCNWTESNNIFKKELILFMQRSQKPLRFLAVNYFHISVDIFVKIVRASLSYYAVLSSLEEE